MGIRLLIVDDHDLIREGLRLSLMGTDVEIVAEAADGREAFQALADKTIDVALVDVRMPQADGFRFLEMLKEAGLSLPVVLMHTVDDGMKTLRRCRELGAMGLIHKDVEKDVLLRAIQDVHAGKQLWNPGRGNTP